MRHSTTLIVLTLSILLVAGCSGRIVTSGDYTLESGKTLRGDLTVFSGDVTLEEESQVTGDIFMTSGNLNANGEVDGDIFFTSGNVDLGPESVVHGDILATSGKVHRDLRTSTSRPNRRKCNGNSSTSTSSTKIAAASEDVGSWSDYGS